MINYLKVVTNEEFEQLGLEKLEIIKNQAKIVKDKYDFEIHIKALHDTSQTAYTSYKPFYKIANEELLKKEYYNQTDTYKSVFKSNIVFPDYNKLFNILLDNKVNYKILLNISKRVTNLKLLNQLKEILNNTLEDINLNEKIDNIFKVLFDKKILLEIPKSKNLEQKLQMIKIIIKKLSEKTNTDKNIEIIVKKLNYYYSLDDYETILTRLIQIVVYEKELYMDYENSKIKSFDKK